MEADDADVVARARDGDNEAFRALVERHSLGLFHLAWRLTLSEADAEDVVQETFLKAHRTLHRFESRAGFGTWLHRIAVNCALDLMRARKRRGEWAGAAGDVEERDGAPPPAELLADVRPLPDRLMFGTEVRRRVAAALSRLSPNERAAFVMRHHQEMSIDEIGRALGLRENAAKQSIFRAVQKLRRALKPVKLP